MKIVQPISFGPHMINNFVNYIDKYYAHAITQSTRSKHQC